MAHEAAVATIQTMFEAFNASDLDRAVSVVHEDATLLDVPMGMTLRGPEGVRQWFATFKAAGPDAHANLERLIIGDDWIASEHVDRFTHTGPLATPTGDVPPTGRNVEIRRPSSIRSATASDRDARLLRRRDAHAPARPDGLKRDARDRALFTADRTQLSAGFS